MTEFAVDHQRVRAVSATLTLLDRKRLEQVLLHLCHEDESLLDRLESTVHRLAQHSTPDVTATALSMERHMIGPNPISKRIQSIFPALEGRTLAAEINTQIRLVKEALAEDNNDWALLMLDAITGYCVDILPGHGVFQNLGGLDAFFVNLEPLWIEALLSVKLKEDRDRVRWQKILNLYRKHSASYGLDELFATAGETVLRGWLDPSLRTILYSSFDVNDQVLTGMTFAEPSMITEARLRILNRHHCYDAYMNLARVTGYHSMYLNMLVEQHRYAEAASEAAHLLKDQASILDVVLALSQANANRYAMYLATRGLRYRSADPRLALWICETALNTQDRPLALRAALKAFEQAPSYETYCQLYNLLGDDWPDLKPSLDVLIEEKEVLITDRISIYLDTEDLEAVLRLVESHDIPTETLRTVVKASILKHPNWSIQKARERADIIMDTHQVSEWPFAFELLTLIKTAHQRTGRTREWEWYLENLMIRHEDKSGLVNQLQNFC